MAGITGGSGNDGATIKNAIDTVTGAPSRDPGSVSVSLEGGAGFNPGSSNDKRYFTVSMGAADNTLIAENMIWAYDRENSFDGITTGDGNDYISLDRSAVRGNIWPWGGNDTVILTDSYANYVHVGEGADSVVVGPGGAEFSQAEIEDKAHAVGQGSVMDLEGGGGLDTLDLIGNWTVTLVGGGAAATVDGFTTRIITSDDMWQKSVALPTLLSGTVSWGKVSVGETVFDNAATFSNFEDLNAVCFTAGTMIETPDGMVAIETLKPGDPVVTADGVKPLSWIGKRRLSLIDLAANPKLLPVLIPAGSFGNGLPTRDVRFSPLHRIVVRSSIAQRMFGTQEVLAAAKHLVGHNGIEVDGEAQEVTYIHLMFDAHTCVNVCGIDAETMYPGIEAFKMLPGDALDELREIFGSEVDAIMEGTLVKDSYLPMLKGREARALAARHSKNSKPLFV